MSEPQAAVPPRTNDRVASPAGSQAGCVVACGLALLLFAYVGSYAYVLADSTFEWGLLASLDPRTLRVLEVVYWPLGYILQLCLALTGY
ncbi:MAG TPA: hypothetical protein VGN57_12965 [Pirellulaceae bacterium]|jgi:hypothetical protein|nr:hypothetical protein [Pirellulaceae bacterium]